MRIKPTRAQITASETLRDAVLAKAIEQISFGQDAFSHNEIKYCLDNDIEITETILYSPAVPANVLTANVPVGWPNSGITEGDVTRQKTYQEYTTVIEVTGGYSLLFHGGYHDSDGNHNTPDFLQLKAWVSRAKTVLPASDGFITKAEMEAIRVAPEI